MATWTVSPSLALPIAPLIVAHGSAGVVQALRFDPVGLTYQFEAAGVAWPAAALSDTAITVTPTRSGLICSILSRGTCAAGGTSSQPLARSYRGFRIRRSRQEACSATTTAAQ